jgi:hypothetical protein
MPLSELPAIRAPPDGLRANGGATARVGNSLLESGRNLELHFVA